jgi:hypothetical protein
VWVSLISGLTHLAFIVTTLADEPASTMPASTMKVLPTSF